MGGQIQNAELAWAARREPAPEADRIGAIMMPVSTALRVAAEIFGKPNAPLGIEVWPPIFRLGLTRSLLEVRAQTVDKGVNPHR